MFLQRVISSMGRKLPQALQFSEFATGWRRDHRTRNVRHHAILSIVADLVFVKVLDLQSLFRFGGRRIPIHISWRPDGVDEGISRS